MSEVKISVLKRSNGFYGVYVNGNRQENLYSNAPLTVSVDLLFNTIEMASRGHEKVDIEFTCDEERFKSGLPSLQDYLLGNK